MLWRLLAPPSELSAAPERPPTVDLTLCVTHVVLCRAHLSHPCPNVALDAACRMTALTSVFVSQRELARRVHTVTGSTHVTWLMGVYFYSTASKCESSSLARTETLREKPKKRFGALLQALVDDDVVDVLPAALPVGVVALARLQALCLAPPRPAPPGSVVSSHFTSAGRARDFAGFNLPARSIARALARPSRCSLFVSIALRVLTAG